MLGVVFIISVHTGEVLDFEIKCKHCFECRVHSKGAKILTSIKAGKVYENECSSNHKKSADKYRKHRHKLMKTRKTKLADKGNHIPLYKFSVESI